MASFSKSLGFDAKAVLQAMNLSQAIIEFDLTGKILSANANFCQAMGYQASEIIGRHHSMFVRPEEVNTPEYKEFWSKLAKGSYEQRQYKRIGKGGREIWIEASYNPVFRLGKPYKVIKFATDITASKLKSAEDNGKLAALSRAQAVIEFEPNGKILAANENFLSVMGYALDEIKGKHHAMFCDPSHVNSSGYKAFWEDLRAGKFVTDQFMRIGKAGKRVFIQASYNPIFDDEGQVFKVVKFAIDVTDRMHAVEEIGTALERLSHCNIRMTLDNPFVGEFESLRTDFNTSIGEFQKTLTNVLAQTHSLNDNSQEMHEAAAHLAERSLQQAAALEQTSTALDQVTATVKSSTTNTQETRKLVQNARLSTTASTAVVQETVTAMHRIESASQEISQIIGVIDEIAFQTNLLALNAGVEAARAGDAGKGFAVVAQEVRELAQRSAKAAKEIKVLINNSGTEVLEGVRLVGKTGEALQEIDVFVKAIDQNVDAIATAAAEQSVGLSEINKAVNDLDRMTQENTAMSERTTDISAALAENAASLTELVNQFKLNRRTAAREPGAEGRDKSRPSQYRSASSGTGRAA